MTFSFYVHCRSASYFFTIPSLSEISSFGFQSVYCNQPLFIYYEGIDICTFKFPIHIHDSIKIISVQLYLGFQLISNWRWTGIFLALFRVVLCESFNCCICWQPGTKTDEIDEAVHQMIIDNGAYPSPLGYGGFPKSVCTSVNECICHGIPDSRALEVLLLKLLDCFVLRC